MKKVALTKLSALICFASCSLSLQAAQKHWMGPSCGAEWSSSCWSAAQGGASDGTGQPQAGDDVFFYLSESIYAATVNYQNSDNPAPLLNSLNIDGNGQINWDLGIPLFSFYLFDQKDGSSLASNNELIGSTGYGEHQQTGGTNSVIDTLTIGQQVGGYGYYNLVAGALTAKNQIVGGAGRGLVVQGNNYGYGPSSNTVSDTLTLGQQIGSVGNEYYLYSGSLSANQEVIGDAGYGAVYQYGGDNAVGDTLTLGNQVGSQGIYNLYEGALSAATEVVGDAGSGTVTQGEGGFGYSSTNKVSDTLTLGKQASGSGTYNLINGALSALQEVIGDAGSGTFNQSGGTNTVGDTLTVGKQAHSQGSYTLNGGALSAANQIIGDAGNGTFTQNTSNFGYGTTTNNISNTLTVGRQTGSNGTYNLIAGTLTALREIIGDAGIGSFNQSGGTNTVGDTLTLGKQAGGRGFYNLSGGALIAANEVIGDAGYGNFIQTGGTNTVDNTLTIAKQAGSQGYYALFGGTLNDENVVVGDAGYGGFHQERFLGAGGGEPAHTIADTLTLGKQASGYGYYYLTFGKLSAKNQIVGAAGQGWFGQGDYYGYGPSSATNTVSGTLTLGQQAGSQGTYNLFAGLLTAGNEVIGDAGEGTFTQGEGNYGYGATNNVDGTLTVGKQAGSQGIYNLIAGTLTALREVIGDAGTGVFNQSGGTNTVGETLTIGKQAGGDGTYNLAAGALTAMDEIVGDAGEGTFTQGEGNFGYSSTNSVSGTLTLGAQVGGRGIYNLIAGALTAKNTVVGEAGTGTFNQSGGTHTVDKTLTLGRQAGSSGVYNLSSGTLSAANEIIGDAGLGTFNQLGGSNNIADALIIGKQAAGGGVYNLTAGELSAAKTVVGDAGTGEFTQTGGTHTTQSLTLGKQTSGYGTYNLLGGALDVVDAVIGDAGAGTFTQSGGTHKVETLTLGKQSDGSGTYYLRGGNLQAGNIVNGAGTGSLLISGGALSFGAGNHDVDVDTLKLSDQGVINLTDDATTTFQKDVVHNGKEINLAANTNAVFNGGFSGEGPFTGSGTATFNSVLNIGEGPVTFNIAGNAVLGEHSTSIMEVAGLQRGTGYDAFDIGGALALNGELDLISLSGFQAHLGDIFDLFAAETITGQFDLLSLMVLADGLSWKIDYLIDAVGTTDIVRLSVVSSVPLPPSVWLMQFALFGLAAVRRAQKK